MNALNTESKNNTVEKESKIQTKLVECVQTLYISDNVDEAINRLLQIIGEFYNAERCYIFEFDNDMNIIHNTYEWCAQGVESELEMLKNVEMSVIERWLYYFETKGEFYINSLSSEVSIDSPEFQILDIQGIKSLMAAPLRSDNKLVGFMGVDNPQENTDSLILMRLVSAFVVNDMQKRETLEQRILRAIGNTYVSMNMVNFREDSQTEIKRFDVVAKYVSRTHGVAEMMRSAMTALTDEETRASTLEFTDLTTAPERLRDVSVLSHDFHSKNHWCRCSFYVMNRDDDGSVIDAIFAVQYIDKEKKKELEYAKHCTEILGVACSSVFQNVGNLSGGNQQKVVISKYIDRNIRVLILDEPTRGIDVGAKDQIYEIIEGLAQQGMAVIVISSEIPELQLMCDRICVMSQGKVTTVIDRSEFADSDNILRNAIGI